MKKKRNYKQFFNYAITGVLTTLVNWLVYSVLVKRFNLFINISNIIAWVVAVIFSFITNKLYVFPSESFEWKRLIKEFTLFFTGRISTGAMEIFGFPLLMVLGLNQSFFGVEGLVAKMAIGVIVGILNYYISKYLVFRNKKS